MKKISYLSMFLILCICACTNKSKDNFGNNEKNLENIIIENLTQISNEFNMTSSNPYNYTKNEYYKNKVILCNDAVNVLENMYKDKKLSGLNAYFSALAIQAITKCSLYEEYNLDWSTAEELYNLWEDHNCSFKK